MLIVLRSFSVITNDVMMVSYRWPPVILSADIHSSYLHMQKKKRKNAFYIVITLSFCWFILKYSISVLLSFIYYFQFFLLFPFLVHVNVHKLYKSIEQLHCYLEIPKTELHWINGLSQKKPSLNRRLTCTQHTKQNKETKILNGLFNF